MSLKYLDSQPLTVTPAQFLSANRTQVLWPESSGGGLHLPRSAELEAQVNHIPLESPPEQINPAYAGFVYDRFPGFTPCFQTGW